MSAALLLTALTFVLLAADEPIRFTDVTASAGIKFTHNSGRAGKKWLPETMGAGCAFFDADGDGWLDDDDPLSDEEKALLEARLAAYEKDPDAGSSWEEVESRVRARLKSPANQ